MKFFWRSGSRIVDLRAPNRSTSTVSTSAPLSSELWIVEVSTCSLLPATCNLQPYPSNCKVRFKPQRVPRSLSIATICCRKGGTTLQYMDQVYITFDRKVPAWLQCESA
jgi:hypothetical protein